MAETANVPMEEDENGGADVDENMDADDDSDSDSSDSDNDEKQELKISELHQKLAENPYLYDLHVELIKTLKQAGELEKLREAREKMSDLFPLSEELWLEWLRDEIPLALAESDRANIEKLFDRAVADYLSVPLWLEYVQYAIGGMGTADGVKNVRTVFERALTSCGLHTSQGANIWEAYREFENAILAGLMPQPGAVTSKEQEEAFSTQNKRVEALFKRQLAIPLLDMEETLGEYEEWSGQKANGQVKQAYDKAFEHVEKLKPLETALQRAEAPRWDEYQALIQHELSRDDPSRIQCVFERAIQENCLNQDIWLQYTKYLTTKLKILSLAMPVYERGLRNCPWSSRLWQGYLLALERRGEKFEKMKGKMHNVSQGRLILNRLKPSTEVIDKALTSGMTQGSDYLLVWTTYCDYLRRQIEWDKDHNEQLETLRLTLEKAVDHLLEYFGTEGDPTGSLRQFWALIEAKFCKNMEKARELWNSIMTEGHGNTANMWMEYYKLERMCGDNKHCRRLLQRALNSVTDWPEAIAETYINFEREEGNLEMYDVAVSKCDAQLQRINERKEKAAEKEALQEEQKKLNKFAKKVMKKAEKQQHMPSKQQSVPKPAQKAQGETNQQAGQKRKLQEGKGDFKMPPPPGYKGEPPPGFKGEPPAKKMKDEEQVHGVTVEHDPSKDDRTVFVSNLSYNLAEEQIKEIFTKSGEITEIRLVKNFKGISKGYAYVEFKDEFCAVEALKLDRELVEGRPMYVSKCENRAAGKSKGPQFKFSTELEKKKLFIKGLPFTCTQEALSNIFKQHGRLKEVRLVTYRSGTSKGIAYVEYESEEEASQAILKTDGLQVGDKTISVAISNPPPRKLPETRMPSLGAGKKETEQRGKARTQVALLPRSLTKGPAKPAPTAALSSDAANGQTEKPKSGMSNADFRSMLLKK